LNRLAELLEAIAARLEGADLAEAQALADEAAAICAEAARDGAHLAAADLARARAALARCQARADELRRTVGAAVAEEAQRRRAADRYRR